MRATWGVLLLVSLVGCAATPVGTASFDFGWSVASVGDVLLHPYPVIAVVAPVAITPWILGLRTSLNPPLG